MQEFWRGVVRLHGQMAGTGLNATCKQGLRYWMIGTQKNDLLIVY